MERGGWQWQVMAHKEARPAASTPGHAARRKTAWHIRNCGWNFSKDTHWCEACTARCFWLEPRRTLVTRLRRELNSSPGSLSLAGGGRQDASFKKRRALGSQAEVPRGLKIAAAERASGGGRDAWRQEPGSQADRTPQAPDRRYRADAREGAKLILTL
jgi:hypothetical protein